ncbi:MAG TPA: TIM44-like domain-containing protein [Alphaproteobacteria bacterium]|nr:TIM44-like domain-containing protein [Alphaproteobacteria bacterium]
MSWVDALVLVIVVGLVASRFFKFPLPWDNRPKDERKGWREVVEKFQPSQKIEPQPVAEPALADATPQKAQQLRAKGKLVVPKGMVGLAAIRAVDPAFDEAAFLKGAREAYSFFHEKWAAKDEDALANLCAPRLLDDLSDNTFGKAPGKVSDIKAAKIANARLNGRTAIIDVDFDAKHGAKTVKSRWTLARAVGGQDPNWELQGFTPAK